MILIGIVSIFFICLLLGVPVVLSLVLASSIPILLDPLVSLTQMSTIMLESIQSFTLLAIPLFIFAADS
ncbi:TRAP transporter large permease subunit [Salibacterium salarium]|uniref:TRAP transporter large permease subunit n=1 Tax=Salibacterium salarium TaxID=284579 RepID=A0A428MVG7_9BACI|nr:TRAP transporter large permease subunit [Salibacterium salarium]RSL30094.1 TRAP transporter large permease subunit [Salibacterium salarium]